LLSPKDDETAVDIELSMCEACTMKIIAGLKARNLMQFASLDSEEAHQSIRRYMGRSLMPGERPDPAVPFDPLVEIHMEIIFQAMRAVMEAAQRIDGCPMCVSANGGEWLDGALNDLEMHFRKKGWLKETVH
jgi:hypothetical protein